MLKHPILRLRDVSDELYEVSELYIDQLSRQRLWLFDLEATGLDTAHERVTQVAGVELANGKLVEEGAFCSFVNPGPDVAMSKEVQDLTGITPAKLATAAPFPEVWEQCLRAARACDYWVGQSAFEFDVPILEAELRRHGLRPELPPILDSVVLATALLGPPEARWSTSALVHRFQVSTQGLRRHDALDDVRILARILTPLVELARAEHDDRIAVPADRPLAIKRHPPAKSQ